MNGMDVQGAQHAAVVDLVLQGGSILVLQVLHVDATECLRLQRIEDVLEDKKKNAAALPAGAVALVAVRGYHTVPAVGQGNAYTSFDIYIDGHYRCSKRYSELETLHKKLKARFRWFTFPIFPGKKMNGLRKATLSGHELDERRQALDTYLSHGMCRVTPCVPESWVHITCSLTLEFLSPSPGRHF